MTVVDGKFIDERTPAHGDKARLADAIGMPRHVLSKVISGGRKLTPEEIAKVIAYFGLRISDSSATPHSPAGFAEGSIAPYEFPTARGSNDIVRTLYPDIGRWTSYRITQDYPGFALARGDVVIIATSCEPETNDLVLVNLHDEMGTGRTSLGKWLHSWITFGPNDEPIHEDDDESILRIVGVVAGVLRGLAKEPDPNAAD